MDNEDDHAGRVNKRIRISLPNASGALSTVTAAVSARGGLVRAVQNLHEDLQRRVVEIDLVAADQKQFAAIIGAIKDLDGALVEGETDPALEAHRGGTITVQARVPFRNEQDFSTIYTPGAARVAQAIARAPELAHAYTAIPHLVALVTNGTAVLGLGDIGPRAAMPVLEGKAVLLDTFALLSGVPILLDTKDPKEMVRTLEDALAAGAQYAADGRTLTSALAVPGLLRGALDARISRFTDAMKLAAAAAIARHAKEPALVPAVLDPVLHLRVARAVRDAARREQALAGNAPAAPTRQEVHDAAR